MQDKRKDSKMDKTIKVCGHTDSEGTLRRGVRNPEVRKLAKDHFKKIKRPSNGHGAYDLNDKYVKSRAKECERDMNRSMSMTYFAGELKSSKDGKVTIVPDLEWLDPDWLQKSERQTKSAKYARNPAYDPFRCTSCRKAWSSVVPYNCRNSDYRDRYEYLGSVFKRIPLEEKICPLCERNG